MMQKLDQGCRPKACWVGILCELFFFCKQKFGIVVEGLRKFALKDKLEMANAQEWLI